MTNPNDQQAITLLTDAFRRWDQQPFPISMSKWEAWILMGLCQHLRRHPHLDPKMLTFVEELGRRIQENICDDPELYSLAETGWNAALDHVDPEDKHPMNKSTQKLVSALEELKETRNDDDSALDAILEEARREQFHDFESPHTFPLLELVQRLRNIGYSDDDTIITRITEGEFDATKEESRAWMSSPEGQDTLRELIGSAPAHTPPAPTPPPDNEGLWVRSDVMPDGTYGVSLAVDADRAWALNRDQAGAYALACFARATEAEHDTAVLRLLSGKLGVPDNDAAALLTRDLRPDRPESHDATAPLQFRIAIGRARHPRPDAGAYIPLVIMELDGCQVGQLTPADLRDHAAAVLNVLAAADLDAALHRVLIAKVGLDDATARAVVGSLAEYWPPQQEPRS